jgi:dUTP pyrophosphatase
MSLYVWIPDETLRKDMQSHVMNRRWTDSGFDMLSPSQDLNFTVSRNAAEFKTGMHFAALDLGENPVPYLLIVRSSTSLTCLRQSNNIGLADAGYRGELIARVDCLDPSLDYYKVEYGRRLFQVCQHNFLPWKSIIFVKCLEDLPKAPDSREDGGFGSTGR